MGMTINHIGATPLTTEQAVNGVPQVAKTNTERLLVSA